MSKPRIADLERLANAPTAGDAFRALLRLARAALPFVNDCKCSKCVEFRAAIDAFDWN